MKLWASDRNYNINRESEFSCYWDELSICIHVKNVSGNGVILYQNNNFASIMHKAVIELLLEQKDAGLGLTATRLSTSDIGILNI